MIVAKIIVDVPANQTDRPFDYLVPEQWQQVIRPGMRVAVPFGPRKLQGFVVGLQEGSTVKRLKEIEEILDPEPVLTGELLDLGFWLSENTLSFAITAFQVMLPAAMKAKYEKEVALSDGVGQEDLHPSVRPLFEGKQSIRWKDADPQLYVELQKEITAKHLDVVYHVKDRAGKKTDRYIKPAFTGAALDQLMKALNKQAVKQKKVLAYFSESEKPVLLKELLDAAGTTEAPVKALIEKGILIEEEVEAFRDPYGEQEFTRTEALQLSDEQQRAFRSISREIERENHKVFLLHGITGSGKTEVYLQAIDEVLKQGKEAIVLVPEISLTPQMVERFKGRFGSLVAVLHSGLSIGEKYDEWRKIQQGRVKVAVGARSAVFAPFENLGMIIIDEEHETSYKQEENPRYHARNVAIQRGMHHHCPVVLGSATPSLESYARASKGVYELLELENRHNDQMLPEVKIVDMREELRGGNRSMFSRELFGKLQDRIEKGEQSVLFLNRRGFSTFVMCRDCGYVIECPHCDISLTYHKRHGSMKCHYCGYETRLPRQCPECESEHIRFFGTGTQKVEEELNKVLPEARVLRMDVDTTRRKGAHEKLLGTFGSGKADILLGTQMIAKGLDFPNVTLVGVLAADTMLHLPDFRAAEKTFQLLTQVSGRAGRHKLPGEVVVQTYTPEHYSVDLASRHDYGSFYNREMLMRKQHEYPPFYFLALISVSHPELVQAADTTDKITAYLKSRLSPKAVVLGPVASAVPRIKDRYRYQCMIKYKNEPNLASVLRELNKQYAKQMQNGNLQISIDMNPYMLM
ncbi:primosomal protein N' [Bacillus marinisedimentorum]|uniref:primosomal protein N' n=1 Tax=Bacillus marinisedimentorum TaxID=1821260 RepID=UPI0007DFE534|nr:primosomal protein N' [Bacillus marinisedimentorum]